jgi:eukaryotic-like serine/threonine-protein kinase
LSSLYLVEVENGSTRRLTKPPDEKTRDENGAFSPNGRLLAFTRSGRWYQCGLYLLNLGADYRPLGEPRRLIDLGGQIDGLAWTADGKEIVYSFSSLGEAGFGESGNRLMRLRIDGDSLPKRLTFSGPEAIRPAISRQGSRMAFLRDLTDFDIWQIEAGKPMKRLISSTRTDADPQYSPDGKRVAFFSDRTGIGQIWACDRDGGNLVQLTSFETGRPGTPRWSPDGQGIAFDRLTLNGQRIYLMAADGGHVRRLTAGEESRDEAVPSWSRDGKWIYYASNVTGRNEIWRAPAQGGRGSQITHAGGLLAFESRDGGSVYYNKDGDPGLWVLRLGAAEESLVLKSTFGGAFDVTEDGVYYFAQHLAEGVTSLRFRNFKSGKDVEITAIRLLPGGGMSVSPDRKTILVSGTDHLESNVMVVDNFR